ncbi:MAG TPA: hypothetical protein PKV21_09745 [bacterium]|nr:hypothetical protein [bacterium]
MRNILKVFSILLFLFSVNLFSEEIKIFQGKEGKTDWDIVVLKNAFSGSISICKDKEFTREENPSLKLTYKLSDKPEYNVVDFRKKNKNKDFSKMKSISIWIYGNGDKKVYLQLGLRCSETGYFIVDVGFMDWTGWKKFEFPKEKFEFVGSFPDWENIEYIFIRANGDIAASKGEIVKEIEGSFYIEEVSIIQ